MTFETILQEINSKYTAELLHTPTNYQPSIRKLLQDKLQGKQIQFNEHGSEAYLIAPGLSKHSNRGELFKNPILTYHAKHHQPSPPEDNGYITLHFLNKQRMPFTPHQLERIEKIALEFHPKLPLPKTGTWTPSNGIYHYESEQGIINADYLEATKGHYHLKHQQNGDHHQIELNISVSRHDIRSLRFKPDILGTGILTSFFKDIGYEGLEKLVE